MCFVIFVVNNAGGSAKSFHHKVHEEHEGIGPSMNFNVALLKA